MTWRKDVVIASDEMVERSAIPFEDAIKGKFRDDAARDGWRVESEPTAARKRVAKSVKHDCPDCSHVERYTWRYEILAQVVPATVRIPKRHGHADRCPRCAKAIDEVRYEVSADVPFGSLQRRVRSVEAWLEPCGHPISKVEETETAVIATMRPARQEDR